MDFTTLFTNDVDIGPGCPDGAGNTNTNTALSSLANSEQYPGSLLLIIVVKISKYLHNSGEKKETDWWYVPSLVFEYLNTKRWMLRFEDILQTCSSSCSSAFVKAPIVKLATDPARCPFLIRVLRIRRSQQVMNPSWSFFLSQKCPGPAGTPHSHYTLQCCVSWFFLLLKKNCMF